MLVLKDIHKDYPAGDMKVTALRGVSISFRKSEFVSILGPSGCGKTTLLNIIGGLDQYTSGDLVISGKSTKNFADADWDAYRNHSIGFVFQSYNLIPHQTVLSNVELALTISGVSKAERRRRAKEALEKVGLGGEINKRPNQMSGGQMQRVAIARALVNNPEILLADEPTGALDSETSVQIMDLLKEIAKDRLVVMVTHNPELAETYSTRIIRILDGKIVGDTNPYEEPATEVAEQDTRKKQKRLRNRSMSFLTALLLSLNNLRTKKGRTILTSFAGSIGIIGIALILAISNGVTNYINRVQEDTLSSYPITIQKETADISGIITNIMNANNQNQTLSHELDAVYANRVMYELMNSLSNTEIQTNNLKAFKKYIESTPGFKEFASAIDYSYAIDFHIFTKDKNGVIIKSDVASLMEDFFEGSSSQMGGMGMMAGYDVWQEMLKGSNGEILNGLFYDQYDLLYGSWPQAYNEIVLIVDENNEISDLVLYSLGLKTTEEMKQEIQDSMKGELKDAPSESWSYEEICKMTFKMILSPDFYQKTADGTYTDLSEIQAGIEYLYNSDHAIDLKVAGIIRPNDDSVASMMTGSIGYTTALTEYAIERMVQSAIVKEQLANPDMDIISGLPFRTDDKEMTDAEKVALVNEYFGSLSTEEKAALYIDIETKLRLDSMITGMLAMYTEEQLKELAAEAFAKETGMPAEQIKGYIDTMSKDDLIGAIKDGMYEQMEAQMGPGIRAQLQQMGNEALALAFDAKTFTDEQYLEFFELYVPATYSDSTYEKNLRKLGYVDIESPTAINIYTSTFANKDEISALIAEYNKNVENEDDEIKYTDLVALLMSSITLVINAISYVLIAFVSVSLVVSSIMIGIITYISVLERTKEIGILRAIGASKKDISRIFNAETAIVGFASGALGIIVTLILILIANPILQSVTGIGILRASLPVVGAVILVLLSVSLTMIAGVIPSRLAAKKDPVVALRTE